MWWVQFWRQTRQFVEEPRCKQPWRHLSPPTQTQCLTSSHLHQKQTYHVIIRRLLMRVSSCLEDWWFYLRGRPMARSEEVDFHCDWIKRSPMNRSFPSHLVSFVSLSSHRWLQEQMLPRWKNYGRKIAERGNWQKLAKFANECHSQADLGIAEPDIWNSASPSSDRWVTDIWNSSSWDRWVPDIMSMWRGAKSSTDRWWLFIDQCDRCGGMGWKLFAKVTKYLPAWKHLKLFATKVEMGNGIFFQQFW